MVAKPKSDDLCVTLLPGQHWSPTLRLHVDPMHEMPIKTCNGSEFTLNIDIELHLCDPTYVFFQR
jgi:hypothetical protein